MEEIKKLTQRLAEKEGQSNQVVELEEKNRIINNLRQELASKQVIITSLNDEIEHFNNDGLGSDSNKGKVEVLDENCVHMNLIDPTGHSSLFLDVEVDPEIVEMYFDKWRNDETMTGFVREKDGRCNWCLYPFGPEFVSMLGTCGHICHHACLSRWLKKS
ncbi:unnamed protein product [Calypogeia fissa]